MPGIDFAKIRQIPIEEVCWFLELDLKKHGKQWRGSCPICQHGSTRCFVVTPELDRYWCHGRCKAGGDQLELTRQVRKISHLEAAKLIVANFKEAA